MPTDPKREYDRMRADHYLHWAAIIGAGAFAWRVHGALIGIALGLVLVVAISASNLWLLANGRHAYVHRNRWLWVILAFIAVALSGISGGVIQR